MVKSMKIGAKLLGGFGTLVVILLVMGSVWLVESRSLSMQLSSAVNVTARKQQLAGAVWRAAADMLSAEESIVLGAILQRSQVTTQGKVQFTAGLRSIEKALAAFRPLSDSASTLSAISALENEVSLAAAAHEDLIQYLDKQQFDHVQRTFDDRMQPRLKEVGRQAELLARQEEERLAAAADGATSRTNRTYWIVGIFLVLGAGAGGGVFYLIHQTNGRLRSLTLEIAHGAEQVACAAAQVSAASQSLAQGASEQAAALQETSASMDEMSSVTHKNTDNSQSTAALMTDCEHVVGNAEGTVRELSGSMQEISESGERITKVVKMIDDIAFQTKILSLNAAVEAARAGAAGAGFAVVADQVGHLAQECAEAARSTAEMIDATVSRVRDGGTKLSRTAEVIQQVVHQVSKVRILVDEVNVGSEEQSKGIDQVSKAITHMQQMTQSTAANAEETASAGQELDSYAESLNRIVARMNTLVGVHPDNLNGPRTARPASRVDPRPNRITRLEGNLVPRNSNGKASSNGAEYYERTLEEEFREF